MYMVGAVAMMDIPSKENRGGTGTNEGRHGGHERANDHNDGSHDEYEKMLEVNTTTVIAASTAIEVDLSHPCGLNQVNRLVLDMVGQGGKALETTGSPYFVQV